MGRPTEENGDERRWKKRCVVLWVLEFSSVESGDAGSTVGRLATVAEAVCGGDGSDGCRVGLVQTLRLSASACPFSSAVLDEIGVVSDTT